MNSPETESFFSRTLAAQIHLGALLLVFVFGTHLLFHVQFPNRGSATVIGLYLMCSIAVFAVSGIYHIWHDGIGMSQKVADIFEHLDHLTIYVFIASCYTVLFFYTLDPTWSTRLIVVTWGYVAFGIVYTLTRAYLPALLKHRYVYTATFVSLGWIVMVRLTDVLSALRSMELFLFILGGAAYTFGAIIYATKWDGFRGRFLNYHEVWHVLVVVGWLAHFGMIRYLVSRG